MSCKDCGLPVYPPGTTYTGNACLFGGYHPQHFAPRQQSSLPNPDLKELTTAIKELTKAITSSHKKGK